MENINQFKVKIDAAIKGLDVERIISNATSFDFCCSDLTDGDIKRLSIYSSWICKIDQSLPTVYWFEITSGYPLSLKEKIGKLQQKGSLIKVPPTNNKNISNSILYVGKVRKNFRGRIIQHLGYGSLNTWSLQLSHWTKELVPVLKLKLNYVQLCKEENCISLAEEINDISLAILEQRIAEKLTPILGRHSL